MESFTVFCITAIIIAAWLTHLFTCLAAGAWGLLIAGALFFPVGIVHGIASWFWFKLV